MERDSEPFDEQLRALQRVRRVAGRKTKRERKKRSRKKEKKHLEEKKRANTARNCDETKRRDVIDAGKVRYVGLSNETPYGVCSGSAAPKYRISGVCFFETRK